MKRIALLLLLALPMLQAAAKSPITDGKIILETTVTDFKVIKLHLANLQKAKTQVTVESLSGEKLLEEVIEKHNGYQANLNLKDLPNGRYILKVTTADGENLRQVLVVNAKGVVCSDVTE
jgi:hypothetical protein